MRVFVTPHRSKRYQSFEGVGVVNDFSFCAAALNFNQVAFDLREFSFFNGEGFAALFADDGGAFVGRKTTFAEPDLTDFFLAAFLFFFGFGKFPLSGISRKAMSKGVSCVVENDCRCFVIRASKASSDLLSPKSF
jgi:hypothetical protein